MDQKGNGGQDWTADRVEARLIAAFRAMPDHPVFSGAGGMLLTGDPAASEAMNWATRFVPDRAERLTLLTWARCRAIGGSASALYTGFGWPRSTAERLRRRALDRVVACLRNGQRGLDSGTI